MFRAELGDASQRISQIILSHNLHSSLSSSTTPMAESVVSFVGQTIGKLLIDEAKFLWGVEGKVKDLQRELELIRCLLRDADSRREHDETVRAWVVQLQDIAYDAEDVVELYILRVAPKKERNIVKACACFVAKCMCVQAHEVGTEIDGLKSRISNLRTSMQAYGIQMMQGGEREHASASATKWTHAHFEEDFVGREDSIKELVKELLEDGKQRRVISIWGMGGLGKTSLARKVLAQDEVKNNFTGVAWACVSQECHAKDVLVDILVKLVPDQRERIMQMRDQELFEALYKIQQEKRCMVVLDDIWTKEAWDGLRDAFPVMNTRSKLLITTRNKDVAKYINPQGLLHELRCLSDLESWDLLKKRALLETEVVDGNMKRLGDELLKKCGGLPLAVNVLGGLLADDNEWERVYEKINLYFSDKSDVSKVLALSYDDLPWHLKPCFLYLGGFPEDAQIPARKVLRMWIAEGFVPPNAYDEQREISAEDVAEQFLAELVNRGMVQVRLNLSGKVKTCHLHDLMRDLCVSKATQDCFLRILNVPQDNGTEDCSPSMAVKLESSCKIRRLSLNKRMIPEAEQIRSTMLHLRTLMLFNFRGWEQLQPIFINCKFLRVLKLEKITMSENLPESVGDLVHIRFLSLAGSWFRSLPQSMGNLVLMEFLDVSGRELDRATMPNVFWKMTRLSYLRLPYLYVVKEEFHGDQKKLRLDSLKNLRTLRNFSPTYCDVSDLGKPTNLQNLSFCVSDALEIIPQLVKFNLKHLQSSSFTFSGRPFTKDELSKMSSYHSPRKLWIGGSIEKLPEHRYLPQRSTKLVLFHSYLKEDPMPILEKLQHLVVLMLRFDAFVGKEMVCSAGGFPRLKRLLLNWLGNLEEWRVAEGAMPRLSQLGISWCPSLKAVPEGVHAYDSPQDLYADHRSMYRDVWRYIPGVSSIPFRSFIFIITRINVRERE
ncbi:putative disease resistance protein At1g50180 [Rhodamnia argentea]|uniref:Disease resistance protein At1g50180 n=1 Tax=Rhodamnia argentea TaxID=178133 RepID=A0A8B8PZG7_9MYRT|nr:putative disease resistance protein At1g50180 [Rhodamnia argentea]